MKGWFPAQSSVVEEKNWVKLEYQELIKCFCSASFLTWGLEATFYPVLEVSYCWFVSVAAKILAVSFWRWTWICLNPDYRTALTRSRSMLAVNLPVFYFWWWWNGLGTVEKTLQLYQDFRERRKAKLGLCSLYMNHAQECNLMKKKKKKNTSWVISGKENQKICFQDDV